MILPLFAALRLCVKQFRPPVDPFSREAAKSPRTGNRGKLAGYGLNSDLTQIIRQII